MEDQKQVLSTKMRRILLLISCLILSVGVCGGPLMLRLYFVNGGSRVWLSSWLQTAGWPITAIPLAILYFYRRKTEGSDTKLYFSTPRILIASATIGVLTGLNAYLYSYGSARLPVSTSVLLLASQLAFTAVGAYFIVKTKLTAFSINAVVLLCVGAAMLGLRASGDRPEGVTSKMYMLGFILTLVGAAFNGLLMPCIETIYLKAKQATTATLVLEIQMVMCFAATAFCTIGMIVNNDFQVIAREGRYFALGEARYYTVLVWTAIVWQCFFVGAIGVMYCSSALVSGIIMSALLPITTILGVVFFGEKFQAEKGVSLFLSLWGFISHFYGEYTQTKKQQEQTQTEMMKTENQSEFV